MPLMSSYSTVFGKLKDALRPFRRDTAQPTGDEIERLREAVRAARDLIRSDRLKTRREAAAHGALRRGVQYLEERDSVNLCVAEGFLS